MNADQQHELMDRIAKEWADKGMIIEGGWQAFLATGIHPQAPDIQKAEMRKAYYMGAQHLFASIIAMLDPGTQETDADLRRMDLIQTELEVFVASLRQG